MSSFLRMVVGIGVLSVVSISTALGQEGGGVLDSSEVWHEEAWTRMVEQEGVHIDYIYYPEADNEHDGIVLRLINERDVAVRYAFALVFRAPEADTTVSVRGRLAPGEMKTGDAAGLFWMPFRRDDRTIGEIGLRGLEIVPLKDRHSERSRST